MTAPEPEVENLRYPSRQHAYERQQQVLVRRVQVSVAQQEQDEQDEVSTHEHAAKDHLRGEPSGLRHVTGALSVLHVELVRLYAEFSHLRLERIVSLLQRQELFRGDVEIGRA